MRARPPLGAETQATAHPGEVRNPRAARPCPPPATRESCGPSASQSWGLARSPASRDSPGRGWPAPPAAPTPRGHPHRRLPVAAARQQDLAQLRAQLPQRRLGSRNLQRPRPLLKPDPQLHGGGRRSPGPGSPRRRRQGSRGTPVSSGSDTEAAPTAAGEGEYLLRFIGVKAAHPRAAQPAVLRWQERSAPLLRAPPGVRPSGRAAGRPAARQVAREFAIDDSARNGERRGLTAQASRVSRLCGLRKLFPCVPRERECP